MNSSFNPDDTITSKVQIKSPLLKKQTTVPGKSQRKLGSMKEQNLDFLNLNKEESENKDSSPSQSVASNMGGR